MLWECMSCTKQQRPCKKMSILSFLWGVWRLHVIVAIESMSGDRCCGATMELLVCIVTVFEKCWWVPCKSDKLTSFVFGPQKSDQNRLPVFLKVGLSKSSLGSLKGCESASNRRTCSQYKSALSVSGNDICSPYLTEGIKPFDGFLYKQPFLNHHKTFDIAAVLHYQVSEIPMHYITFLSNWAIHTIALAAQVSFAK